MIVWLASYPKSGNTWIRSFIYSLLFSSDGNPKLDKLNQINQFPSVYYLKNFVKNFKSINEIKNNWITGQEAINLSNKITFLKTHHALCTIGKDTFTNIHNTAGVIHIVRDPRNVITSIKYHYSKKDYLEAKEFLFDKGRTIGLLPDNIKNNDVVTFIGSWKDNYNSWKKFKKNYLILKYENLLNNPKDEFKKLTFFLKNNLKLNFNEEKIDEIIKLNSFENLKRQEEIHGFEESVKDKSTGKNKKFFNLGPKNDWKNLLDDKIRKEIENKFDQEMIELGYL